MRIIRLPTDGLTLATESTLSLEERGKPIDGFTGRAPARLRDAFLACLPSSNNRRPPQSGERQRGGLAAYSVSLRLVRRLLNAADGIYLASHCGARRKPEMPAVSGCGTWFIQPHCPFGQWP